MITTFFDVINNTNLSSVEGEDVTVQYGNDSDDNISNEDDNIINNGVVQAIFCILYTSIFILGIFGNVLVCYVVLKNKAMHTVTNYFITNLALSDILMCVLAVPFTPLYTFLGEWIFGRALCHLVSFAQGCSIYISTLTLTAIAIDRFLVIIFSFRPRMKISTCISTIISIWTISLLITLPYGFYVKIIESNETGVNTVYCEESWPDEDYRQIFGAATSLFQFVFPFLIISVCYICVSIKLNDRVKARPGSRNSRREEADRERKKRTNKMLISMVAIFGISWLPLNVVNIFNDFYTRSNDWKYINFMFFVAHCIGMSSTCYNPFLYAWLNENFRKEFKQVLPCFNRSNTSNGNITSVKGRLNLMRICNGNTDAVQDTLIAPSTKTTNVGIITRESQQIDNELCLSPNKKIKTIDNNIIISNNNSKNILEKQETIVLDTILLPPPPSSTNLIKSPLPDLKENCEHTNILETL